MTDQPDLRQQIVNLFHDGYLYRESPAAIADAVLGVLRGEREQWARQMVPYSGQLQSQVSNLLREWWPEDGPREVLVGIAPLLLATKVEQLDAAQAEVERLRDGWPESDQEHTRTGFEHLEESKRLRREVEFEANGERWANCIVGRDGHYFRNYGCECGGSAHNLADWEKHLTDLRTADGSSLCACPSEQQAAGLIATGRFSLPQCSRHPREGGAS